MRKIWLYQLNEERFWRRSTAQWKWSCKMKWITSLLAYSCDEAAPSCPWFGSGKPHHWPAEGTNCDSVSRLRVQRCSKEGKTTPDTLTKSQGGGKTKVPANIRILKHDIKTGETQSNSYSQEGMAQPPSSLLQRHRVPKASYRFWLHLKKRL